MPPFWRWIGLVGLAVNLPGGGFHPYVAPRLARELAQSSLPRGEEVPIRDVLDLVAERMINNHHPSDTDFQNLR